MINEVIILIGRLCCGFFIFLVEVVNVLNFKKVKNIVVFFVKILFKLYGVNGIQFFGFMQNILIVMNKIMILILINIIMLFMCLFFFVFFDNN